jgi:hypothetical protein
VVIATINRNKAFSKPGRGVQYEASMTPRLLDEAAVPLCMRAHDAARVAS